MKAPTPEQQAELARNLDPRYFIESNIWITDKNSAKAPFVFNEVQADYYERRTRRDLVLKARKMGFTTLFLAVWLHACAMRPNTRAVVVSHEKEAAARLLERAKFMRKHSLYPIRVDREAGVITFPETDSSFWIGSAGSRSFGRGDDLTHVLLSEAAFYEDQAVLTGVNEALVDDAWVVVESTANGAGTPFHNLWLAAERGENDWAPHFYAWWRDPTYSVAGAAPFELDGEEAKLREAFALSWGQLAWRRNKLREMVDPALFPQEYPSTPEEAFLTSGRMVFDWAAVLALERGAEAPRLCGDLRDAGERWVAEPWAVG